MLNLFLLGRHVEDRLGRIEFLKFYLIAIIVSGLGFTLIHFATGQAFSYVVGASGGVTAVLMLFVFMFWNEQIRLFGIIPMPAWILGVILVLSDLSHAFQPDIPIAWEAHMVGSAFGAVYFLQKWNFRWVDFGGLGKTLKR